MIFQYQGIPAAAISGGLRFKQSLLELQQIKRLPEELLAVNVIGIEVIEVKDGIQFLIALPDVSQSGFSGWVV